MKMISISSDEYVQFDEFCMLVIVVQFSIGGIVLVRLLMMMFCEVVCFRYMVQIIVQLISEVKVSIVVIRFIYSIRMVIDNMISMLVNISICYGLILLIISGCYDVCVICVLMCVFSNWLIVVVVEVVSQMLRKLSRLVCICFQLGMFGIVRIMLIRVVKIMRVMILGLVRFQYWWQLENMELVWGVQMGQQVDQYE